MVGSKEKLEGAIESSQVGTRCIKSSIDKALAFIRLIERNCSELSDNIRKAFRQFIIAIEDRERFLLDFVEKLRQRRLAILHDQMAGLCGNRIFKPRAARNFCQCKTSSLRVV